MFAAATRPTAGAAPARYLAFKNWSPRNTQGVPKAWISKRVGGDQIDYADEPQIVRKWFSEALANKRAQGRAL